MTNIPRRKIYETMLEFEDGLVEMQILILNDENFSKYKESFEQPYEKIKNSFKKIKALLVMFLENRKYPLGEDFEKDLLVFIENEKEINKNLENNQNLERNFKELCKKIDEELIRIKKIEDITNARELFILLDDFNTQIPEILTIRRDMMK